MQALAQQLTAAFIEGYCRGQYAVLGHGSKGELPRDWLSELLITPLLKAACRWVGGGCCAGWVGEEWRRQQCAGQQQADAAG
jgi:hypothetical protein